MAHDPDPFGVMHRGRVHPEGPTEIRLDCLHCDTKLVRGHEPPYDWYHEDDEIVFNVGSTLKLRSTGKYDHKPEPDILDVEILDE